MKRFFKLVVVLAMIGGWPLALSSLHVVHTPGPTTVMGVTLPEWASWRMLTKDTMSFRETFVDTRKWTLNDIADHKETANRLDRAGLGSSFAHAGTSNEIAEALKGVKVPEPTAPAAGTTVEPAKDAHPIVPAIKVNHETKPVPGLKVAPATQPTASEQKKTIFDF